MAGERKQLCRATAQPGGRPPAPEPLALVQSFINTHFDLEHDHGAEVLSSTDALGAWLHNRGLIGQAHVLERDLDRAISLREALRAFAAGDGVWPDATQMVERQLEGLAADARLRISFAAAGPTFVGAPEAGVDGAFGALLAIVVVAIADGSWSRLKICPGHDCGWAFYDGSRNRSGRWCSMSVCGGREKARAHYRRHRRGVTG